MKKILCALLSCLLTVSLFGCSDKSNDQASGNLETQSTSATSSTMEIVETNSEVSSNTTTTSSSSSETNSTASQTPTTNKPTSSATQSKHTHNYSAEVIKESTCELAGEILYTCSGCGNTYTEKTNPLGHTTDNGVCSRCGVKIVNTKFLEDMAVIAVKDLLSFSSSPVQVDRITYMDGPIEACSDCSYVILVEYYQQNKFGGSKKRFNQYVVIGSEIIEAGSMNNYRTNLQEYMRLTESPELDVQTILSRT